MSLAMGELSLLPCVREAGEATLIVADSSGRRTEMDCSRVDHSKISMIVSPFLPGDREGRGEGPNDRSRSQRARRRADYRRPDGPPLCDRARAGAEDRATDVCATLLARADSKTHRGTPAGR